MRGREGPLAFYCLSVVRESSKVFASFAKEWGRGARPIRAQQRVAVPFPRVCFSAISIYLPRKGVRSKHHLLLCVPAELRARASREYQVELEDYVSAVMLLWEKKRITLPERQGCPPDMWPEDVATHGCVPFVSHWCSSKFISQTCLCIVWVRKAVSPKLDVWKHSLAALTFGCVIAVSPSGFSFVPLRMIGTWKLEMSLCNYQFSCHSKRLCLFKTT